MWTILASKELSTCVALPRPHREWSVPDRFYMGACLAEVSVMEQIYGNFQIPRNPGGTEHAQTDTMSKG